MATRIAKEAGVPEDQAPLLPTAAGDFVEKAAMVAFFKHAARQVGVLRGVTGHMTRVSGARRMARAGIELWQIQLFARWESAVILRYVRDAPLTRSHLFAQRLSDGKAKAQRAELVVQPDLTELVDDVVAQGHMKRGSKDLYMQLAQLIADKLEEVRGDRPQARPEVHLEELGPAEGPGQAAWPNYVLNGRHMYGVLHRPRDHEKAYCGWAWRTALDAGEAVEVESEDAVPVCRFCASRGRAQAPGRPSLGQG